eukprot:2391853-Rhodomonas_salina.2
MPVCRGVPGYPGTRRGYPRAPGIKSPGNRAEALQHAGFVGFGSILHRFDPKSYRDDRETGTSWQN